MLLLNRIRSWWQNFDENYKRVALTILFSITVAFLAYAVYYVFFKPAPPARTIGLITEIPITSLPGADIRDILEQKGIIEEPAAKPTLPASKIKIDTVAQGKKTLAKPQVYAGAQSPNINKNGSIRYYNKSDGKFYTLDSQGNITALSQLSFPQVQNVVWSPQEEKAILEFPDGSNIFYDFEKQKQHTLPKEGEGFNFATSGNQIGYKFITENPDENWLIVSDPNGDNPVAIEHIGKTNPQDILINWSPDGSRVALFRNSAGLDSEEILFVGQNKENFKSLSVAGRGFEGLWSRQGDKLLYNIYSPQTGYRPELWIANAKDNDTGEQNKNLSVSTWASKCAFTSDNINVYCAVPLYLKQGAGIYPDLMFGAPDVIYKINAKTGFKQQIAVPTNYLGISLYAAKKLMLSPDEKILYMADSNNGIYKIQLK